MYIIFRETSSFYFFLLQMLNTNHNLLLSNAAACTFFLHLSVCSSFFLHLICAHLLKRIFAFFFAFSSLRIGLPTVSLYAYWLNYCTHRHMFRVRQTDHCTMSIVMIMEMGNKRASVLGQSDPKAAEPFAICDEYVNTY